MVAVPPPRSAVRRDWIYWLVLGVCFGIGHGIAERLIRARLASFWGSAGAAERRTLASRAGLRVAELNEFLAGVGTIPFPKQVALRSAVIAMEAAK